MSQLNAKKEYCARPSLPLLLFFTAWFGIMYFFCVDSNILKDMASVQRGNFSIDFPRDRPVVSFGLTLLPLVYLWLAYFGIKSKRTIYILCLALCVLNIFRLLLLPLGQVGLNYLDLIVLNRSGGPVVKRGSSDSLIAFPWVYRLVGDYLYLSQVFFYPTILFFLIINRYKTRYPPKDKCLECGYNIMYCKSSTCPECGAQITSQDDSLGVKNQAGKRDE